MDLRFLPPDLRRLDESGAELVACAVWSDERPLRGLSGLLDWRFAGKLSQLAKSGFLAGDLGEVLMLPGKPRVPFEKVLVFGLGPRKSFGDDVFKAVTAHLSRALEQLHVRKAVVELPGRASDAIEPERATELLMEIVNDARGEDAHDAWWLVERPEIAPRIQKRADDERRRTRRTT